ncbi:alpha/beta hydrolase fold domain-containing protein [Kribbella monticola]|uniref:alpha/beta hydrolase fold domain-containing protein n=1 Tax=Kribbella monticola TaxID=2185285 RepID=UPI000DD2FFD9|nr:alpha/beta hydrolase fold domain-containing protein [Kribbella monticola]
MNPTPNTAAVQLRGPTGPIWARLYSPPPGEDPQPPLLVVLSGDYEPEELARRCEQLCLRGRLVVLACPTPPLPETSPPTGTTPYASAEPGAYQGAGDEPTAYDAVVAEAKAIVGWAADHAGELDADPARLLLAGSGTGAALAAEVARLAAAEGWPDLTLYDLLEGTPR